MDQVAIDVTVREVKNLLDTKAEFLLLDCRTPAEYAVAKIAQAVLIPLQELPQRLPEIAAWREKRVVVHCHHGGRSLQVTQWLRGNGFDRVQNMVGGIDAWSEEIDAGVPRY